MFNAEFHVRKLRDGCICVILEHVSYTVFSWDCLGVVYNHVCYYVVVFFVVIQHNAIFVLLKSSYSFYFPQKIA